VSGPLAGVRVVDFTTIVMGPFASQMLADLGAEVTKIEALGGDAMRYVGPKKHADMGPNFLHLNRGKRSLALDLKQEAGRAALLRLVKAADVFLYSLRPHTLTRLGLAYAQVAAENPQIIYAGCFGYSQRGPNAARPAYDDLIQGACGLPSLVQRATGDEPRYPPINLADRSVGLYAAMAINAALYERARSGLGQEVQIPMFETLTQFVLGDHMWGHTHEPPIDGTAYVRLISRERRPFRTLDGHVCVLIYSDKQWQSFLALIGEPRRFSEDPRFGDADARTRHVDEVQGFVASHMATRSTAHWLSALEQADIPVTPMNTLEALLDDPHHAATGFFEQVEHPTEGRLRMMRVPAEYSRTPARAERLAPRLGEHSRSVLAEAGYTDAEIDALIAAGITREVAP
jgi:crotonobetainyl-CoA:carnitine CoA-transferase CaiB-like acyl-CoA transferase